MAKYLSHVDLERIAESVANRYYKYYGQFPKAGCVPYPINPEKLARDIFGLRVSYLPLSSDGSVLGIACFGETDLQIDSGDGTMQQIQLTERDIVVDDSLLETAQTGRRNFTIAHEIAHHVLVRMYPEEYHSLLNCRTHILYRHSVQRRQWEEWQADTMAAAILMPPIVLKQCMAVFGLGEKLDILSSSCRPTEYGRFCEVAAYMEVSKKALAIRMQRLGLLGKDFLADPDKPLDIWRDENDFDS